MPFVADRTAAANTTTTAAAVAVPRRRRAQVGPPPAFGRGCPQAAAALQRALDRRDNSAPAAD